MCFFTLYLHIISSNIFQNKLIQQYFQWFLPLASKMFLTQLYCSVLISNTKTDQDKKYPHIQRDLAHTFTLIPIKQSLKKIPSHFFPKFFTGFTFRRRLSFYKHHLLVTLSRNLPQEQFLSWKSENRIVKSVHKTNTKSTNADNENAPRKTSYINYPFLRVNQKKTQTPPPSHTAVFSSLKQFLFSSFR